MYLGGGPVFNRGSRPENDERETEMFAILLFAEITGNLTVALAALSQFGVFWAI